MAVGTYALISLAELKTYLSISGSTDDTILENSIDRATARIERHLGHNILVRSYTEWKGGNAVRAIRLSQYPINSVTGVYTGNRTALTVGSTISSDLRVTVSVNPEAVGTGAPGLIVTRQASSGAVTTSTLPFSTHDTASELVSAIAALTGLTSTLVFDCAATQLHPRAGGDALVGTINLTAATQGAEYVYESESGIVHIQSDAFPFEDTYQARFPSAYQSICINYSAGYTTTPDDMKQAALEVASYLYQNRKKNIGVTSESLGDYSYTRTSQADVNEIMMSILGNYRDIR
jgi:hypothetical protein